MQKKENNRILDVTQCLQSRLLYLLSYHHCLESLSTPDLCCLIKPVFSNFCFFFICTKIQLGNLVSLKMCYASRMQKCLKTRSKITAFSCTKRYVRRQGRPFTMHVKSWRIFKKFMKIFKIFKDLSKIHISFDDFRILQTF